jgi:hypothetical protein
MTILRFGQVADSENKGHLTSMVYNTAMTSSLYSIIAGMRQGANGTGFIAGV